MDDELFPPDEAEDQGPIGIFPNWAWVYWSVVIYTAALIVVLAIFTVVFDHSVQ